MIKKEATINKFRPTSDLPTDGIKQIDPIK
jgi:hypothetical protein